MTQNKLPKFNTIMIFSDSEFLFQSIFEFFLLYYSQLLSLHIINSLLTWNMTVDISIISSVLYQYVRIHFRR